MSILHTLMKIDKVFARVKEDINEAVKQMDDVFTTIDLVRFFDGGSYTVGLPINKALGRTLSEGKNLLSIEQLGRVNDEDDDGRPTTTHIWKKIKYKFWYRLFVRWPIVLTERYLNHR